MDYDDDSNNNNNNNNNNYAFNAVYLFLFNKNILYGSSQNFISKLHQDGIILLIYFYL